MLEANGELALALLSELLAGVVVYPVSVSRPGARSGANRHHAEAAHGVRPRLGRAAESC